MTMNMKSYYMIYVTAWARKASGTLMLTDIGMETRFLLNDTKKSVVVLWRIPTP